MHSLKGWGANMIIKELSGTRTKKVLPGYSAQIRGIYMCIGAWKILF